MLLPALRGVDTWEARFGQRDRNIRYIAHASNHYGPLLDALAGLLEALASSGSLVVDEASTAFIRAEAALKAARGRPGQEDAGDRGQGPPPL